MKSGRPFVLLELVFGLIYGLLILGWGGLYDLDSVILIPFFMGIAFHLTAMVLYLQSEWRRMNFLLLPGRALAVFLMILWLFVRNSSSLEEGVNAFLDNILISVYALYHFAGMLIILFDAKKFETGAA